jgi:protein-disulfide isomerase
VAERRETKREATQRRAAARRAAEAAERARAARRRRNLIGGAVAAVVVVVALVVVFAVQSGRTSTSATAAVPGHTVSGGTVVEVTAADVAGTASASATASGSAASGSAASAPVVVNLYEDLQCPNCKAFEAESGSTLAALLAQGKVVLHYHPMAFLDSSANGNFSTRALNAAAVVLDAAGPGAFQKFHDLVYAHQTPEAGPGMTDAQLVAYANQAGATGDAVTQAIDSGKYTDWTTKETDQASKDGVTATPTVIIGGTTVTDLSPSGITAAVTAASSK